VGAVSTPVCACRSRANNFQIQFSNSRGRAYTARGASHRSSGDKTRPQYRGRRECRVFLAPAVSRANKKSTRAYSPQVRRTKPAFPARWIDDLFHALPGDRACCLRRLRSAHKLDASVGATGPRGFIVRDKAHSSRALSRPPHPASRFVTIAHTPLLSRRDKPNR
jgi:hypothetical protein